MSLNKKHTIIIILCLTFGLLSCQDKTSKIWLHCTNEINKAKYFQDKDVMIWYIHNNPMIRNRCIKLANNNDNVKVLLVTDEVPFYKNKQ